MNINMQILGNIFANLRNLLLYVEQFSTNIQNIILQNSLEKQPSLTCYICWNSLFKTSITQAIISSAEHKNHIRL
uniref:Uncharacterized protein n=1 Tax=Acrobeloides nanus TaxID=290746 RepID=A0A914C1K6_9BILA